MTDYGDLRERMVAEQLAGCGISDPRVLEAMATVPRELFLPESGRHLAYADAALAIGEGQTISQPWILAAICQALELAPSDRVLEVGTGSGYSTAVLARLAATVLSIERLATLAGPAAVTLGALQLSSARVRCGDGSIGAPDAAPFDAIAVHAGAPGVPAALLAQLAPGGRLVLPLARGGSEELTLFRRSDGERRQGSSRFERSAIAPCRFVPLLGAQGYPEP